MIFRDGYDIVDIPDWMLAVAWVIKWVFIIGVVILVAWIIKRI